ncbi:MAG: CO/xanthine dehydrogenase Mo-binding subunit [Gammaproteobacteria bacterium]|jgi:CO/xanthine dehydrogenase Mo-binding subunit
MPGQKNNSVSKYKYIGTRPVRPDGLDKVTGRADFGADFSLPGMIYGKVLRSPYAHAKIKSIDYSAAMQLEGVLSVVCRDDFPLLAEMTVEGIVLPIDVATMSRNVMARDKVLYHGHAVAAIAATSLAVAEQALRLIDVQYEVLPHVLDIDSALAVDAPVIDNTIFTEGLPVKPTHPSNLALQSVLERGDIEAGFSEADLVIEKTFTTPAVHQGYIEPHSCVASMNEDKKVSIWCSTQGAFAVRAYCAYIMGVEISDIKVTSSEIGGGFGGKLLPYLEPLASVLSRKAGRPVKMTMTREEIFRATGPAPATRIRVKVGAMKSGKITAMEAFMEYEAGAFKGGSMHEAQMNIFSCYNVANLHAKGIEVLVNKPNVAPYRAPGLPQALLACENVIDELAQGLNLDPVDLRLMNVSREGDTTLSGLKLGPLGLEQVLLETKAHPHYRAKLPRGQGRGVACAFYIGGSCHSSATIHLTETGKINLLIGTPDIGGSRAAMALMVAERLDVDVKSVFPQIGNTETVGFSDVTGGSRVTVATGIAVVQAAEEVKQELCKRAAAIWEMDIGNIFWESGTAHARNSSHQKLTIEELARTAYKTGGSISKSVSLNTNAAAPSCSANLVDVSVDKETGKVEIVRFTTIQDAGTAIHPDYVEGQMQGGAAQGIGWALNEEYVFDEHGKVLNSGFLDYRIPVASDLPMIDTVIVEVPNPNHPYGVRGVGETPICAPMAAVAIAVNRALGTSIRDMPLNPSRVMDAILKIESQ